MHPAAELQPFEEHVWTDLVGLVTRLPAVLDTCLQRQSGLTHFEYRVLSVLAHQHEQRMQLTELAAQTDSSLSRLSHVLSKLEQRRWIRRERSPKGRGYHAILTLDGHQIFAAASHGYVRLARLLVFDEVNDRQLPSLRHHLQKLRDCVEAVAVS